MKRIVLIAAASLALVVATLGVLVAAHHGGGTTGRAGGTGTAGSARGVVVPSPFPYPSDWQTTLTAAQQRATFLLLLPNDPAASSSNVVAVYVYPNGAAVAVEFPAPATPQTPVRQDYIEVWEQPWTGSADPQAFFASDLAQAPQSAALYDVNGVTALGVTARAPEDDQHMNPAFLRMDVQGVDVQISGGDSLDLLLRVARTIVKVVASPSPAAS